MSAAATIVDWLAEQEPHAAPLRLADMSDPSKTWLDRMWHAMLAMADDDLAEKNFDELNALFIAYLDQLDEYERLVAESTQLFLARALLDHRDEWRCPNCGRLKCPHCGRHRGELEPVEA